MMAAIEFDKLEKCQDKPYLSSFVYHWKVKEVEKSIYKSAFVASPPFSDPCRNTWWHLRLYRPRRKFKRTGKYLSLQLHLDSALPVLAKFTVVANLGSGKKCCRAFFRNEYMFDVGKPFWVSTLFPLMEDLLPSASLELRCKIQVLSHTDSRPPGSHDLGSLLKHHGRYDIVLAAGPVEIPAHRLILCATSSELAKLLDGQKKARLEIPDLPPDTLKTVLDFIYHGSFRSDLSHFPTNKVQAMLVFALKYGISSLRWALERYLVSEPTLPPFHSIIRTALVQACKRDENTPTTSNCNSGSNNSFKSAKSHKPTRYPFGCV